MKYIVFTLAAVAATSFIPAVADPPPFHAEMVPTEDGYQVQWPSRPGFVYRVESSPDLETWLDAGLVIPGDGGVMGHNFELLPEDLPDEPRWFHRIVESPDTDNARFLLRPSPGEMAAIEDGVGFSFDLDVFPDLPDRVRIHKRPAGGVSWELIGAVTEFAEIRGVRFPRGSTVWIPEEEGSYDILVQAVDENDQIIGQASRPVHIIPNSPPSVTITGGPPSPSAEKVDVEFTTTVADPDGDEIRRVEFYDNGVLMGGDDIEPFGDRILDADGKLVGNLWKGVHSITARAIDSKGAAGPLSEPCEVVVTGGNAQPQVSIASATLQNGILTIRFDADDPDGNTDIASVVATNLRTRDTASAFIQGSYLHNVIHMLTTGWSPGTHTVAVMIRDKSNALGFLALTEVSVPGGPPPSGNPLGATLAAVIADETTLSVSNALHTGEPLASGVFSGGLPRGLQMDEGVAMTTGRFDSWNKGNLIDDTTEIWGLPGDEELYLRAAARETLDAASLEFDVFCPHGQLVIEHQLGSEEYMEYVQSHNDAFAIFVNGVPVSLLPDASDIVAVHTVHYNDRNRHLYLDYGEDIQPVVDPACEASKVEYNGLTIRLRANALVTPGRTHRVRIVIADVNDAKLDSALFLEKDSLKSIQPQP